MFARAVTSLEYCSNDMTQRPNSSATRLGSATCSTTASRTRAPAQNCSRNRNAKITGPGHSRLTSRRGEGRGQTHTPNQRKQTCAKKNERAYVGRYRTREAGRKSPKHQSPPPSASITPPLRFLYGAQCRQPTLATQAGEQLSQRGRRNATEAPTRGVSLVAPLYCRCVHYPPDPALVSPLQAPHEALTPRPWSQNASLCYLSGREGWWE